ncbi:MAG: hypothetical protein E7363_01380 [Clostridiales bacterium]|nr:hypothetical protein [Clostridiales bacterium]
MRYSAEEKYKILKEAEKYGIKETIKKYNVARQSIWRWTKKFKEKGKEGLIDDVSREKMHHPAAHTQEETAAIKLILNQNPYIPHNELYKRLVEEFGYNRNSQGLFNFLKRNKIRERKKRKRDYSTMFNSQAVERLNGEFLYLKKDELPLYVIEIDRKGIYLAKGIYGYPCGLTIFYSMAKSFKTQKEAEIFIKKIENTSQYKIEIAEIK